MDTESTPRILRFLFEGLIVLIILALVTVLGRWAIATTREEGAAETPYPLSTPAASATPTIAPITLAPTPAPLDTPTPTVTPTLRPTPHPPERLPDPPVILTDTDFLSGTLVPLPIPSPMPLVAQSEEAINILLLGSDQDSSSGLGRTDVMIVVSIDPALPSVSLLSIPRDFYAWIPEHGFNKINTAYSRGEASRYPGGGPGLVKATIEYNFGIRIHYYAQVGFDGFIRIVDALGGVDVAVECPLSNTFPDPDSPTGQTDVDWSPGIEHLDGKHALWYVRSRWQSSDFDRNRRQQQVLRGLYRQVLTLDVIPKIPELWGALRENVSTDLGLEELLYLADIGSRLDTANVRSYFVGAGVGQVWYTPDGAWVFVPYYDALALLVQEALTPPAAARAAQPAARVEVWNATANEELGYVAAERLLWEGFHVVAVQRVTGDYPRTQVWDFTTTSKGSPLGLLLRLYQRNASDVVYQPSEERQADFRVILGADYNPCAATQLRWITELPTPTPLPPTPTPSPRP